MWMFWMLRALAIEPPCAELSGDQLMVTAPVTFASGKATLADGEAAVAAVVCAMAKHPELSVQVEVHTDSRGSGVYNTRISQERADSLRRALLAGGLEASRVTAVGYGELYPMASNATTEGRLVNRRVEFHTGGDRPEAPALPEPAPQPSPRPAPVTPCSRIDGAMAENAPRSWSHPLPLGPVAAEVVACLDPAWQQDRDGDAVYASRTGWSLAVVSREGEARIELTPTP